MSTESRRLWNKLEQSGLVCGTEPDFGSPVTPWYVRVMLGIAGWVGALFLLGFVAVGLSFVVESTAGSLTAGVLLTGIAVALFRALGDNDFIAQFAFAISLAGQVLILLGLAQWLNEDTAKVAFCTMLLGTALFWLVDQFLHRFWSALVIVASGALVIGSFGLASMLPAFGAACFTALWLTELRFADRCGVAPAFGYALTIGTLATVFSHRIFGPSWWLDWQPDLIEPKLSMWLSAAALGLTVWLCGRYLLNRDLPVKTGRHDLILLVVSVLAAVISTHADGLVITALLIVIAHAIGNWPLLGVGLVSLLAYLSYYYYQMDLTLLTKSAVLLMVGSALLLGRWVARRMGDRSEVQS